MNRRSAAVMNWRNRTKMRLVEYKGGKCSRCGYDKKIPACYDFHHEDSSKKDFTISGKSWSFERLLAEVDKCVLLCRNCHGEVHDEMTRANRTKRMAEVKKALLSEIHCKRCNRKFKPNNARTKFCSSTCARLAHRKVERPDKQTLQKEIESNNWVTLGRKYGVTDNAVRKWAKKYGITAK